MCSISALLCIKWVLVGWNGNLPTIYNTGPMGNQTQSSKQRDLNAAHL